MKKLLTIGAVAMFATPAFAANNIFFLYSRERKPGVCNKKWFRL